MYSIQGLARYQFGLQYGLLYRSVLSASHKRPASTEERGEVCWELLFLGEKAERRGGAREEDHRTGEFFWQSWATTAWEPMLILSH